MFHVTVVTLDGDSWPDMPWYFWRSVKIRLNVILFSVDWTLDIL